MKGGLLVSCTRKDVVSTLSVDKAVEIAKKTLRQAGISYKDVPNTQPAPKIIIDPSLFAKSAITTKAIVASNPEDSWRYVVELSTPDSTELQKIFLSQHMVYRQGKIGGPKKMKQQGKIQGLTPKMLKRVRRENSI